MTSRRFTKLFEGTDRIAPLVAALSVGGAFVAGGVLGYFAESGKVSKAGK